MLSWRIIVTHVIYGNSSWRCTALRSLCIIPSLCKYLRPCATLSDCIKYSWCSPWHTVWCLPNEHNLFQGPQPRIALGSHFPSKDTRGKAWVGFCQVYKYHRMVTHWDLIAVAMWQLQMKIPGNDPQLTLMKIKGSIWPWEACLHISDFSYTFNFLTAIFWSWRWPLKISAKLPPATVSHRILIPFRTKHSG